MQVLSPCVTYRPEQKEWRNIVHPAMVGSTSDSAQAARRLMTDDGFNIGVLYRGDREPFRLSQQADAAQQTEDYSQLFEV